jgi:hypothetical protein
MSSVQTGRAALQETLAFVEGSRGSIVSVLAADVRAWLASPQQGLAAAVESVRGADDTADALARLAPSGVTVVGAVRSDNACWVEVTRAGDGEPETCIVGLTYDGGAVSRLVWLRSPLVPARAGDGPALPAAADDDESATPDARPIFERYFADLVSSDFAAAAAHFAGDTIYSHPPYAGGKERVLYRGREALLRGFVTDRGPSPVRQVVTGLWQRGDRVFVEGVIEGIPNGGTFFSTAELNTGGEIARYVAFYSARRIPA